MSNQSVKHDERHATLEEIEVAINDVDSQIGEDTLLTTVKDLQGVRAVRVARGGAMISYNPAGITEEEICDAIRRAGFTIDGVERGRQSPQRPNPEATKEPLDHLRPPPNVHEDPGHHEGQ